MVVMRLKHVHVYQDRHGRKRAYLRIPGRAGIRLEGSPGSPEFIASYNAAVAGLPPLERPGDGQPGSIRSLLTAYYKSSDFTTLTASTQRAHKGVLERFAAMDFGGSSVDALPANGMTKGDFLDLLDELADKPGAWETTMKRVRKLYAFAIDRGKVAHNPATGIKSIRDSEGHEPWSDADIAQFERKWPSGTRERRAMALFLYTGQRRSDVAPMGRQHVRDGMVSVKQEKTDNRLWIPIHAALHAELPSEGLTFLVTEYGVPFTANGLGGWFSQKARDAGLKGRTAHGLRKSAGRRLAEAGCSAHEIMSVLGLKSLSEAERYTRDAGQIVLARRAIDRIK